MNQRNVIVCLALAFLALAACSRPPGSGRIDGIDIGLHTELYLSDLAPVELSGTQGINRARRLVAGAPEGLDSLRHYTAIADMEEDGTLPVDLWVLPVAHDHGGGMLALALDPDGRVVRSRVWSNSLIDSDADPAWKVFWSQFEGDASRSIFGAEVAPSSAEVAAYRNALLADTSASAAITRLLYEHRLIMYHNSYFVDRVSSLSGGDRVPPSDWIEEFRNSYDRLPTIAEALRSVIGDSAVARYSGVVSEGAEILSLVAESAAAGQGDAVLDQTLSFRRRTCGACHGIENHTAGPGKLKSAVSNRLEELGVRRDLYAAGLDVWTVPEEVDLSQAMADAVKAVLIMAGAQ